MCCNILLIFLLFFCFFLGVGGLRNVRVLSPGAVAVGESIKLECHFDLEGDHLYAVKWYKGKKEFYRYLPKENPPSKVFPLPGVEVDVSDFLFTAFVFLLPNINIVIKFCLPYDVYFFYTAIYENCVGKE